MANIRDILRQELEKYTGEGLNGISYLIVDDSQTAFGVVGVASFQGEHIANMGLFVQLLDEQIIISKDINDKPLHEALIQAGIPRSQIVLAYAGEKVDEASVA